MTTTARASTTRRPRGQHPRKAPVQQFPGEKGSTLPEHLEAREVQAVLAASPNPRAEDNIEAANSGPSEGPKCVVAPNYGS